MKSKTFFICIAFAWMFVSCQQTVKDTELPSVEETMAVFDSITNQTHISPGSWRPLFNSEQIFWISPPWSSSEYIYFDFPEAIFVNEISVYLSHVNRTLPTMFNYKLPKVRWKDNGGVISYERHLGDYLDFGGEVGSSGKNSASMKLWIRNKTDKNLENITLQTCAYLYPIKEFNLGSHSNKYVHTIDSGWVSLDKLWPVPDNVSENGTYKIGWRKGPALCDLPYIIASSKTGEHHVSMTWFENTLSFVGNSRHPCFHADPFFPDIKPGETATIHGEMVFYEGSLSEFCTYLMEKYSISSMTHRGTREN